MDVYIGLIMLFAGNFAPRGFAFCAGQIMSIQQYTALYSLLGTFYGGDGVRTFALPDLRGRVPVGAGAGPGLSPYDLGQQGGVEHMSLLVQNLPAHNHLLYGNNQTNGNDFPGPNHVIGTSTTDKMYTNHAPNVNMSPSSIGMTGSGLPFEMMQPYQAVNYIIAVEGLFPSRN